MFYITTDYKMFERTVTGFKALGHKHTHICINLWLAITYPDIPLKHLLSTFLFQNMAIFLF